jgi:hypothetical protein
MTKHCSWLLNRQRVSLSFFRMMASLLISLFLSHFRLFLTLVRKFVIDVSLLRYSLIYRRVRFDEERKKSENLQIVINVLHSETTHII